MLSRCGWAGIASNSGDGHAPEPAGAQPSNAGNDGPEGVGVLDRLVVAKAGSRAGLEVPTLTHHLGLVGARQRAPHLSNALLIS